MSAPQFDIRVECMTCRSTEWFVDDSPDVGMDVEDAIRDHLERGCDG